MFNNLNLTSNDSFLGSNSEIKSVADSFDYNSFYRAIVVSNEDPEHLGRIKINIPALHSNISSSNQYPWAYPGVFVGLGNQVGQFILPPIGSIVFVSFEYSDEHRPIYFGGVPTQYASGKSQSYGYKINGGQSKDVTNNDIPTEYDGSQAIIYKSPTGAIIYMDDFTYEQKLVIQDSQGQQLLMDYWESEDGEVFKSLRLAVDDDNYILMEPDQVTLCISGISIVYDKDHWPGSGGGGGTSDYPALSNKPQINGVTLIGNKTSENLGLQSTITWATNQDIDNAISLWGDI